MKTTTYGKYPKLYTVTKLNKGLSKVNITLGNSSNLAMQTIKFLITDQNNISLRSILKMKLTSQSFANFSAEFECTKKTLDVVINVLDKYNRYDTELLKEIYDNM